VKDAFQWARAHADRADGEQERNRLWWEHLPMTYVDWTADRLHRDPDSPTRLEATFLDSNPWLQKHFDFEQLAGQQVLEVGCGAGSAACLFARAGATVTAIDITQAAIELSQRNANAQGLHIDVFRMDAERTDFPDASFDYIFSWGVLHHTRDTKAAFREIARVLKPGGRGLLMVYNRHSLRYWLKGIYWLMVRMKIVEGFRLASVQRFYTDGYYHRHFSQKELRAALVAVGLRPKRLSVTHMWKQMIPLAPRWLDETLKRHWGWLLVAEF